MFVIAKGRQYAKFETIRSSTTKHTNDTKVWKYPDLIFVYFVLFVVKSLVTLFADRRTSFPSAVWEKACIAIHKNMRRARKFSSAPNVGGRV